MTTERAQRIKDWLPVITLIGLGVQCVITIAAWWSSYRLLEYRVGQLEEEFHNGVNHRLELVETRTLSTQERIARLEALRGRD